MNKQRNNHARSKRKRKLLRLQNYWKKVCQSRLEKLSKSKREKQTPIVGRAKDFAVKVDLAMFKFLTGGKRRELNQRQRRKLERQTGRRK